MVRVRWDEDIHETLGVIELSQEAAAAALQNTRATATVTRSDVIRFLKSLDDQSVDLIVTDPAYSGMNRHLALGRGRIVGVYNDRGDGAKWFDEFEDTEENYDAFLRECQRVLRANRHIYIMFDSFSLLTLGEHVRRFFDVKNIIVWDKTKIGMGHYFRRQSEFIVFASKGKRSIARRDIPDIWRIARLHRAPYPTQKPVEVFEAMIAASRNGEDEFVVCDPFAGSGSAAIAALRQGCSFVGCDVAEAAVSLAQNRIATYLATGADPAQPSSAIAPDTKVWW